MSKESKVEEVVVRELVVCVYTIILPGIVIIRDSELKEYILQNRWYIKVLESLGWTYKGPLRENDSADEVEPRVASEHEEQDSNNIEMNQRFQEE